MGHQRLCRQACPPGGWWAGFCCKAPALWAWLLRPNRIEPQYVRRRSQRYKCTGPRPLVAIDRRSSARCSLLISTFILQNKIGTCYVVRLGNQYHISNPRCLGWDLRYHVGVYNVLRTYKSVYQETLETKMWNLSSWVYNVFHDLQVMKSKKSTPKNSYKKHSK